MMDATKRWFLGLDNKPVGPLSVDEVAGYVRSGNVWPGTLAWREGFASWVPLGETELAGELWPEEKPATAGRAEAGSLERSALATASSASFAGGFFARSAAAVIDVAVVGTATSALVVFGALMAALWLGPSPFTFARVVHGVHQAAPVALVVLDLIYFVFVTAGRGTTLGLWACGLKLERDSGEPVTLTLAAARHLASFVAFSP
jgi:hypothetical protein